MPGRKEYRGGAGELTLASALTAETPSFTVEGDTTGWPAGGAAPFVVDIDYDQGGAEKLLIESRSGTVFTVVAVIGRGFDGTTASSHAIGAVVRHVADADTLDEVNAHVNDDVRDDHPQYLNLERHDDPARHAVGETIASAAPTTSLPGDTVSEGSSGAAARADHKHAREALGGAEWISLSEPGDEELAGTSGLPADANHQHAREAWGLLADIADIQVGQESAPGNSGRVADANHRHALGSPGAALPSAPGDVSGAGSSTTPARSDHVHGREEVFGLAQDLDANDADSAQLAAGSEMTLQTVAKTTTGERIFIITGSFTVRPMAVGAYAGVGNLKMNGSTMFGADRRFHSYSEASVMGGPIRVSWLTLTTQPAGSYTFTMTATNDAGGPNIAFSNRDLNVYTLGGS